MVRQLVWQQAIASRRVSILSILHGLNRFLVHRLIDMFVVAGPQMPFPAKIVESPKPSN